VDLLYVCGVFLLSGWVAWHSRVPIAWGFALPLAVLALWGLGQLIVDATVYRYATLLAAVRYAALAATAFLAQQCLTGPAERERFLRMFAGFGFVLAGVSVTAYYTSPSQVLWTIPAQYPDVWGPFLSRNNFAQFLELTFPIALWLAFRAPRNLLYWSMAAVMLSAGLASASRAGAALLILQALAAFVWQRRARWALGFAAALLPLAALAGAGTLLYRLGHSAWLDERAPIFASTLELIETRPFQGYGVGTYAAVYPEFARFDSGHRIEHAHNDWLELSAEGGLVFTATWGLLAARALVRGSRHLWSWGVPAICLHALVDFPLARTGIAAWLFLLLGAMENSGLTEFTTDPLRRRRTT
jgi:O-antigen ligase